MKHRWWGSAEGLIYIVQQPHPLKQSAVYNGSVPFGYSLNSSFDTGNDSWLSSGGWQVLHLFRKCCRCSVGRESGRPRGLALRGQLQCTLHKSEEERWTVELSISGSDVPFYMLTLSIYSAKLCIGEWKMPFEVICYEPMVFMILTCRWQNTHSCTQNQITCKSVWSANSEPSVSHCTRLLTTTNKTLFHFQTGLSRLRYKRSTQWLSTHKQQSKSHKYKMDKV